MGRRFRVYTMKGGWAELIHDCLLENWSKNSWCGKCKGCFPSFLILQELPGSLCQLTASSITFVLTELQSDESDHRHKEPLSPCQNSLYFSLPLLRTNSVGWVFPAKCCFPCLPASSVGIAGTGGWPGPWIAPHCLGSSPSSE